MRTFYSLTKRQFLGMTKFNKFLYGNSKEKKVFHTYILFASYILAFLFVLLTMLIGILLKKASKLFNAVLKVV